jgi:hypothetical protein
MTSDNGALARCGLFDFTLELAFLFTMPGGSMRFLT